MENNINLVAFGTFGNPNGFMQTFFAGNNDIAKNVKTFDIKIEAIKLFPTSNVYSIRKEMIESHNTIAYSIYTFAKEQSSERGGTFIGSSIIYANSIAPENITINCLNEFNDFIINRNVVNGVINVKNSDELSVKLPNDFEKIGYNLNQIDAVDFNQVSNKSLVVYSEVTPDKLQKLFSQAIGLLNRYDTIYFTSSKEVAEYVYSRGIFKLVQNDEFIQEIESVINESLQKIQFFISECEKEKLNLEEERSKTMEEYLKQIKNNIKTHKENEQKIKESKAELDTINRNYEDYKSKIDSSINLLKSGNKIEEVKQKYMQEKRYFLELRNQNKAPLSISIISLVQTNDLAQNNQKKYSEQKSMKNENPKKNNINELGLEGKSNAGKKATYFKKNKSNLRQPRDAKNYKLDIFKVMLCLFLLILIILLLYLALH